MRTHILVILSMLFSFDIVQAQIDIDLDNLFKENRRGNYVNHEVSSWLTKKRLPKKEVLTYALNKNEQDILFAYKLIYYEILITDDLLLKQENVYFIINQGLIQNQPSHFYALVQYLDDLPVHYFNTQSKSKLSSLVLTEHTPYLRNIIRLCGKLNITSLIPFLESRLGEQDVDASLKWDIQLALGRMGDLEKIKLCLDKVKRIGVNDRVLFYLIPDLLYLNNRICFDYILQQILIDEKNCTSTNPDNEVKINCAFRLVELIAPYIKDFPIGSYETGDLITDDYDKTLLDVRNWILSNNYLYELNKQASN